MTQHVNLLYILAPLATLFFTSLTSMGGIGGAFILVPIFNWLGIPIYEAATLGIAMAFFTMGSACVQYQRGNNIRYKMAGSMIISIIIFSPLASYISAVINKNIVLFVFFLFLVTGGSIMLFYHPKITRLDKSINISRNDYTFGFLAGIIIGFVSGLLGVGGGILIAPFLIWRGFTGKDIPGTSAFVVVFSALAGFLSHFDFMHLANVHFNYLLFALVIVAGSAGGFIGARLARFKLTSTQIKWIIGTLEYSMSVKIIFGLAVSLPFIFKLVHI